MISTWADVATAIGRSAELSILVKATLALVVGLTAATLARRTRASIRHLLLACALGGALALPLAAALASRASIEIPIDLPLAATATAGTGVPANIAGTADIAADDHNAPTAAAAARAAGMGDAAAAGASGQPGPAWSLTAVVSLPVLSAVVRMVWAAGALWLLASLATSLWRLMRIRRCGVPWLDAQPLLRALTADAGVRRDVDLLLHEDVSAPFTCGLVRSAIVLPIDAPGWSDADLRRALVHELEHVRRGDWAVHLIARAACAAYWFNPLAWVASRKLCLEAERACDDAVIRQAEETEYAEQLVSLARRLRGDGHGGPIGPVLAMANRGDLSARVSALLDATQPRGRAGALTATTAIAAAVVAVLAIAPVRAVRASSDALVDESRAAERSKSADRRESVERSQDVSRRDGVGQGEGVGGGDGTGRGDGVGRGDGAGSGDGVGTGEGVGRGDGTGRGDGVGRGDGAGSGDGVGTGEGVGRGPGVAQGDGIGQSGDTVTRKMVQVPERTIGAKVIAADAKAGTADADARLSRRTPFDESLYAAAERGDVDGITQLLDAGANVNAAIGGDGSPLIAAARKGHLAAVRLLLDRGADPNMGVPGDGSPLIMAAARGQVAAVELLLTRGAEVDRIEPGDENALIQASGAGHLPVVKLLIARGADVNASVWVESSNRGASRGEWRTPLTMARKGGHTAVVAALGEAGARD